MAGIISSDLSGNGGLQDIRGKVRATDCNLYTNIQFYKTGIFAALKSRFGFSPVYSAYA